MQVDPSCLFSFRVDDLLEQVSPKERRPSRRLLGRLRALHYRVRRVLKQERHYVDASLIYALDDFVIHIRQAPVRELYDATTIPYTKDAEVARSSVIEILEQVRKNWAVSISCGVVRPPNIEEKMSIGALIN